MERYYQKEIECASQEQIKAWQDERLVRQVRHVWDKVPYYRAKMEEKGVTPEDIRGRDDLYKLPFLSKADLRDAYPFGLLAEPLEKCIRIHSTSGTTGKRVVAFYTKEDIDRSSEVFTEIMSGMITTLIAVAALIFVVVMYLMSGIMIDRAAFGISLVKIFGYGKRDVKKLYLSGNAYTVGIGGLISIPLAKLAMDAVFPALVPNIACGINLSFPWYMYLLIYAGVMAVYFITSALLSGKLNRITPAEVLKNRE